MKEIVDGFINREGDIFEFGNSQEGGSCTQSQVLQMIADSEVKAHRHEISEINGLQSALEEIASESGNVSSQTQDLSSLNNKIDKVSNATSGHIAVFTQDGSIEDGGNKNQFATSNHTHTTASPAYGGTNLISNGQVYEAIENLKPVKIIEIQSQLDPGNGDKVASRNISGDTVDNLTHYYCFSESTNKYFALSANPKVGDTIYTYEYDDGVDSGNTPGYFYRTFGTVLSIQERGGIGSEYAVTVDSSITDSSNNPVKSSAIYTALSGKADYEHTHSISQIVGLSKFKTSLPIASVNEANNEYLYIGDTNSSYEFGLTYKCIQSTINSYSIVGTVYVGTNQTPSADIIRDTLFVNQGADFTNATSPGTETIENVTYIKYNNVVFSTTSFSTGEETVYNDAINSAVRASGNTSYVDFGSHQLLPSGSMNTGIYNWYPKFMLNEIESDSE